MGSLGKGGVRGVAKQVKVERPRPLKIGGGAHPELSLEDLLVEIERLRKNLGVKSEGEQIVGQLQLLAANLKISGATLELSHKDQMDKLNHSLMTACRAESLDLVARVHMLELIELRTMGWQPNENVTNYYKQKLAQIEYESTTGSSAKAQTAPVSLNPSAPDFNPFNKSFDSKLSTSQTKRIPTELKSDLTKFANSKPRNTGVASLGDIQTNLPPPPSPSPPKSEPSFECVVKVGNDELKVSGVSLDLVKTAKIVLNEFFNICNPEDAIMESPPPELDEKNFGARRKNISGGSSKSTESDSGTIALVKPEISYEKQELMAMAKSPLCKVTPSTWGEVTKELPGVVRRADRAGPTSKIIQREMEGLRKQEEAKNV